MTPNLADRLEVFIPRGDGYNSDYADTLTEAVEELRSNSAPAEPSREAVEVVGTRYSRVTEQGRRVSLVRLSRKRHSDGWHCDDLMTVNQHNRIVAALTAPPSPDAELVKLLNSAFAELEDWRMSFPDANSYETDKILVAIDAKLASLGAQ